MPQSFFVAANILQINLQPQMQKAVLLLQSKFCNVEPFLIFYRYKQFFFKVTAKCLFAAENLGLHSSANMHFKLQWQSFAAATLKLWQWLPAIVQEKLHCDCSEHASINMAWNSPPQTSQQQCMLMVVWAYCLKWSPRILPGAKTQGKCGNVKELIAHVTWSLPTWFCTGWALMLLPLPPP